MMKKRPTPEIDWANPLKACLARHGFWLAATYLGWVPEPEGALRAWHGYPRCLDDYPTRLSRPGTWWMARKEGRHE